MRQRYTKAFSQGTRENGQRGDWYGIGAKKSSYFHVAVLSFGNHLQRGSQKSEERGKYVNENTKSF